MRGLSWRQQLQRCPNLRDVGQWPVIPIEHLPAEKRQIYLHRLQMIAMVLSGRSVKLVAEQFSCHFTEIYRLLKRTLESKHGQSPALRRGLLHYNRLERYQRQSPLTSIENQLGSNGCFRHLLENVPGLKERLDQHLIADLKNRAYGENLSEKIFHGYFLNYLREYGWSIDKYPFCHKHLGYESCRNYFHDRRESLRKVKEFKRIIEPVNYDFAVFEELQIDEHTTDLNFSIGMEFNGQIVYHRVSRATLICIIERASDYILAHRLCLNRSPDQYDFLKAIRSIYRQHQLIQLKGTYIQYPNTCHQLSSFDERLNALQVGRISVDNAWCHHANLVENFVCNELNATLNFGVIDCPQRRALVESIFNLFNQHIHRLKSTTGSHVRDPSREKVNKKSPAPQIMHHHVFDLFNVLIAKHNTERHLGIQAQTPVSRLTYLIDQQYWGCPSLVKVLVPVIF